MTYAQVRHQSSRFLAAGAILTALIMTGCASPQDKEARFMKRGRAYFEKKDYTRAALEFQNAATVMPKDPEPYFQQGLAYKEIKNLAAAFRSFQRAATLDPKHAGAQLQMAELMTSSSDPRVVEMARKQLEDLLASAPNNTETLDALAVVQFRLGKPDEGINLLEQ